MAGFIGVLRRGLFGISEEEASFKRRGFRTSDPSIQQHLEYVGRTFIRGYRLALKECSPVTLAQELNKITLEFRGYAYEGAAMALTLLDSIWVGHRNHLTAFISDQGKQHTYLIHVGAGWAMARLNLNLQKSLSRLDPLLRWLAVDGFGFHEGYFHVSRSFDRQERPSRLTGYQRNAFDQGLGRSLWFVEGGDVDAINSRLNSFARDRQPDLWSGIGLACTYAGGRSRSEIERLVHSSGEYRSQLAQGAAFAAKARERAQNPTEHTEFACQILCNCSAEEAAYLTDQALENLPEDGDDPSFATWRSRIKEQFIQESTPL